MSPRQVHDDLLAAALDDFFSRFGARPPSVRGPSARRPTPASRAISPPWRRALGLRTSQPAHPPPCVGAGQLPVQLERPAEPDDGTGGKTFYEELWGGGARTFS